MVNAFSILAIRASKAASAWSLGQIGRHSPDHAKACAILNVLGRLLAVYLSSDSSDDLKTKAKRALKAILQKCIHLEALEPLLADAPRNILKYIVHQVIRREQPDPQWASNCRRRAHT